MPDPGLPKSPATSDQELSAEICDWAWERATEPLLRYSREAAQECSPGRKPWVNWETSKPQGGERIVLTQTLNSPTLI
jgi:hypothetical protein